MRPDFRKQNLVIIIMAKVPRPGTVKTRLNPFLNENQCVELAICFLKDTVLKATKITENIIVAFSPNDGRNEIEQILPDNIILVEQFGENLGERMQSAIEFAENKVFCPIIVIGTDSPSLPSDYLQSSIDLLTNGESEVVIGAAKDGGYYLIGFNKLVGGIFENVEWSTEKTFVQTYDNAERILGIKPLQVPTWYDVDTPQELGILYEEFLRNKNFRLIAPNTVKWLEANENLFILKNSNYESDNTF